jgi:hypothetical protein
MVHVVRGGFTMNPREVYLGDGLYASWDNWQIPVAGAARERGSRRVSGRRDPAGFFRICRRTAETRVNKPALFFRRKNRHGPGRASPHRGFSSF